MKLCNFAAFFHRHEMKHQIIALLGFLALLPFASRAQKLQKLSLPNHEQLSAERVLHVLQDAEGFLWYATEGGGLCRDDGRQMLVFRSDAAHPHLLGSNNVACIAEAGHHIIIGTFHGACVLDKEDYSISKLKEVDDKRVDDIIVTANGHWWLTANKKVYEYAADGQLLKTYTAGNKYINRLHEDQQHRLWASQWDGGLLRFDGGKFVQASWPLNVSPTDITSDSQNGVLLIGTVGKGVVRYEPDKGTATPVEQSDSICMSRVTCDLLGRKLVSDGLGNCYALSNTEPQSWFKGATLTKSAADSLRATHKLSASPTAFAFSKTGNLWFSTGRDIRYTEHGTEHVVLSNTKDVSAMTFDKDGTLWLATIFGNLMAYKNGKLINDEYGSNEYSDGVTHLEVDQQGRLVLVSNRYIRLYDPVHRTLQQQSREKAGVYCIELQKTQPGSRWSQPEEQIIERLPQWVWWSLSVLCLILLALFAYIWQLHRQRKKFLAIIKKPSTPLASEQNSPVEPTPNQQETEESPWLQSAIVAVEAHMNNDNYGVEQLASDMCMSRMTFYRKIQSATGQKPSEFIRTIRLRRAAELLRQGNMNITEISYATGFSSVSYFSRCFHKLYGEPPTQYGKIKV